MQPSARRDLAWALALGAAVAMAYGAAVADLGLLYDDELLVLDQATPRGPGDLLRAFGEPYYPGLPYYRPLTRLTYAVQKALHGTTPWPYHLFNATLIGAILCAAVLLLRRPAFGIRRTPALLAAGCWAAHPVTSSCVHPVAGRDSLLPALFVLLSVAAHLSPGRVGRAVAWAAFAAALACKEQAAAVPLLFLLADLTGVAERPVGWRAWSVRYAPAVAILLGYGLVRSFVLERTAIAPGDSLAGPLHSLLYGLQSTLVPTRELLYEPPLAVWWAWPGLALAAAVCAALGWWVATAPSGPARRSLFWVGWFVVVQLPTANFLKQETLFDERYVFLAVLGPTALVATLASVRWDRPRVRRPVMALGCALIVGFFALSLHRATYFTDSLTFHRQWIRTAPNSAGGHNGLAVALARSGDTEEARRHYEEALRLEPGHAQAHNNLGVTLWERGEADQAQGHLENALELRPDYAEAHYNLANLLAGTHRPAEALSHYERALRQRPAYPQARNNYAALLVGQGRIDEAMEQFEQVVRLDPEHARARYNLGVLHGRQGRFDEARRHYREALRIDPNYAEAHFSLGAACVAAGATGEAIRHFRRALELRPGWPEAILALDAARETARRDAPE